MCESPEMSKEEFRRLAPGARGYAVYWYGERDDQPNVPNESNPYPAGSTEFQEWARGQSQAMIDAQDSEE